MAAGLGFKDFTTGEVLTAADVDGYLMQGIWVFASAAARDAAVTSPQEGNFAFLKDTNTTTYYTGSAWTNLDTTGMVNPMTTTGDTIYSSSGSTPARLGIGTAGQVLTVNSGATAPEWATPSSGGGITLLETLTLSGSSTTSSSIAGTYKQIFATFTGVYGSSGGDFNIRFNSDTGSNYDWSELRASGSSASAESYISQTAYRAGRVGSSSTTVDTASMTLSLPNYSSTGLKIIQTQEFIGTYAAAVNSFTVCGAYRGGSAISTITILVSSGTFSAGEVKIYGVN